MPKLVTAKSPSEALPPMPIDPEQVKEGNPDARGVILVQSADRKLSCGLWQCNPCKFEHTYAWDEFARILEGEATISEEGGNTYTLAAGDFAHFPLGLKSLWEVKKTVHKVFFLRTPEPLEL